MNHGRWIWVGAGVAALMGLACSGTDEGVDVVMLGISGGAGGASASGGGGFGGASTGLCLAASADTMIGSNNPNNNYGTLTACVARNAPEYSCLMRWDIAPWVPPAVTITSATLSVVTGNTNASASGFALKKSWAETQATWLRRLSSPTVQLWDTAGAKATTDRGADVLLTIPAASGTHVVPLTPAGVTLVRSWVSSPTTNYGLVISNTTGTKTILTRETPTFANRPTLCVTW